MKDSMKQTTFLIICLIIVFIPTYIAITYFCIKSAEPPEDRYTVRITAHNGESLYIDPNEEAAIAESVLKMNTKLIAVGGIDSNTLPVKYYDITVTDNGTVSSYRYYFSTDESKRTIVLSESGAYYTLDTKDTKAFLSRKCAYLLYETSALPTLSIFGGNDVSPSKAEWKYKAVNGSFVDSPYASNVTNGDAVYAMSGHTSLSFSIEPDEYTVRVYKNGDEILISSSLSEIPYELLDSSSLHFRISAKWTSSNMYRGSMEYDFSTSIALAPKFSVSTATIESGECFTVTGFNISAPQKIEFSSTPSINFTPVFFPDGENVHAIIPIDKDLPAPMTYTFRFTYGESVSELKVSVAERTILEREYNCSNISVSRTEATIAEYESLLREIGMKYEGTKYINSEFIDYTVLFTDDVSTIKLGYGHIRVPSYGAESFRLDGVDYLMTAGMEVPALCAGKVVYEGECDLLGKFVVLDHGLGLKTWYCNLSEGTATVGTIIAKGDSVGKSGSSGYTNSNGVYLITTVLDVPISPYPLQEYELTFPNS